MMTLTLSDEDTFRATQFATEPLVYLDHAPLMEIAAHHAPEFQKAITGSGGTLGLSLLNFAELSRVSDSTAAEVDALLRMIAPHIVFLESLPNLVVAAEDRLMKGGPPVAPHFDGKFLAEFAKWGRTSVNPMDVGGFVNAFRSAEEAALIRSWFDGAMQRSAEAVGRVAKTYQLDPAAQARVRAPLKGSPIQMPTRYVWAESVRFLIKKNKTTPNDIADSYHAVVPVSYCDYVVLDKGWKAAAEQIQSRVGEADLLTHRAGVFSVTEIPEFIAHVGAHHAIPG